MTFKIPSKWVSTIYKCSCLILQWNTKCIDALHFDSNKSKKNKLFIFWGGFYYIEGLKNNIYKL